MSIVLENLRRDARMRIEMDNEMSVAWLIVPLLPIIGIVIFVVGIVLASISAAQSSTIGQPTSGSATLAIIGFIALFEIGIFIVLIVFAIMIYKLAKRRNTHFQRQLLLYEDLVAMTREISSKKGVDVSMQLNNLERTMRESRIEETEKSAALWAILCFITGIATLYVQYYLMKDFFKHERREDVFFEDLTRALIASGVPVNLPRRTLPIPDRSFILYFILSLITLGLFNIYWIYVLLSDPNNHFRQQWMIEDTLIAQTSPILGGPSMPSPPNPPPPTPMPPPFSSSTYTPSP